MDDAFNETFQGYTRLTKTSAKMAALSHNSSAPENPVTKLQQTDMPDIPENFLAIDRKCLSTLPDDTLVVDGSSVRSIRKLDAIVKRQMELGIDVAKYVRLNDIPPELAEKFSWKSARIMYCHDTRSLIVKLVGGPHESAAGRIDYMIIMQCASMGLSQSLRPSGSLRLSGVSSAKEPDGSFIPTPPIPGRGQWPTIIIEVAATESYRKLTADADWWFSNSKGAVNVVIIVAISQKKAERKITFETVILESTNPLRPLAQTRRRRYYKTSTRQKITTSRAPGPSDPGTPITVHPEEDLRVTFEEAFDRPPIPPEHDLLFTPDVLRMASREVWESQDLAFAEKSAQSMT
ncbi:uncharacterized protein N7515_003178 [Penicillium bovifimosum]|uniref:Uncharacterized protein n=1 Tax=Penicillium bovifimosum TaxID=126998 RepID=A0A9W9L5Z5_9EURO|nr:uncharacterized protein N7515_003178 [Penicillium bovifimosum]KAJ5138330.1 hypothetical protein N7515_003178 [Penicillium bovifimosum]